MNRHIPVWTGALAVTVTLTMSAQTPATRATGDQRRQYVFAPTGQWVATTDSAPPARNPRASPINPSPA